MKARDFRRQTKSYRVTSASPYSLKPDPDTVDDIAMYSGTVQTPHGLVSVHGHRGRRGHERLPDLKPYFSLAMWLRGRCWYYQDNRITPLKGAVTIAGRFARDVARMAAKR